MRPERKNLPWVVVRFDNFAYGPEEPWIAITVISLFDEQAAAEAEVERLNTLNAGNDRVYFRQRAKKYFRQGHDFGSRFEHEE